MDQRSRIIWRRCEWEKDDGVNIPRFPLRDIMCTHSAQLLSRGKLQEQWTVGFSSSANSTLTKEDRMSRY